MRYIVFVIGILLASPALALDSSFKAPAVGTELNYGNWGYTITGVNGYRVTSRNTSGDTFINFAHFVTYKSSRWANSAFSLDREALKSIWPLKIGKSVDYDIKDNSRVWRGQLAVVGIETAQTPAGTFECFKIERKRREVNGDWSAETQMWYSPQVRFIVKWKSETTGGRDYGATTSGSLVSFRPPNNENSENISGDVNVEEAQKTNSSVDERLQRLKSLREQELITKQEYQQKRKEILEEL